MSQTSRLTFFLVALSTLFLSQNAFASIACSEHSDSASCAEDSNCQWCEPAFSCVESTVFCTGCENVAQESCDETPGCYWCNNKNTCLHESESCTCGDGALQQDEECDFGGDTELCIDCACIEGYEPDGWGGCKAACEPECDHGMCIAVDTCECYMGWEGDACEISSCAPDLCEFVCADYDKTNCDINDCTWCRATLTCIETDDVCLDCPDLIDETECEQSDGFCHFCEEGEDASCRRSTISCTCFNGVYDPGEEACESDLDGVENCNNCNCGGMFEPDGSGGCIRTDCYFFNSSESLCNSMLDCQWCTVAQSCNNTVTHCLTCEEISEEYCENGVGCAWCANRNTCQNEELSCSCGDGALADDEDCDDILDPSYCDYCTCAEGFEPDGAGACVEIVIDGDVVDGDVVDGDVVDGDVTDGDVVDGDTVDGDVVDGDTVDGDVVDGDVVDGDTVDGDAPDGDVVDGDVVDGDVVDGDVVDGDTVDGDAPDGDVIDGDVVDGDVVDGDVVDGDVVDGDTVDGDVVDGDVIDGDVTDGDIADGDTPDGDTPEDGDQPEDSDKSGSGGGGCSQNGTPASLLLMAGLALLFRRRRV